MKLSLQQLSERADVPGRSIRFYIQKGLLAGPEGEKRGAYYTEAHLADLLRIRHWQESGLSLDAIAGLLMARSEPPVATLRAGAMEVRTHLILADGLELMVAPERARLTQAQLRVLFRQVQDAYAELCKTHSHDDPEIPGDLPHEPID
ncbi:MAG: MerR family transcriptional regulator [Xanthomonadales bacterium]|nr:MerR family transcriptional regulator [Xanthomonadales bacterium]